MYYRGVIMRTLTVTINCDEEAKKIADKLEKDLLQLEWVSELTKAKRADIYELAYDAARQVISKEQVKFFAGE